MERRIWMEGGKGRKGKWLEGQHLQELLFQVRTTTKTIYILSHLKRHERARIQEVGKSKTCLGEVRIAKHLLQECEFIKTMSRLADHPVEISMLSIWVLNCLRKISLYNPCMPTRS